MKLAAEMWGREAGTWDRRRHARSGSRRRHHGERNGARGSWRRGSWMGGALGSAVTGRDAVNGSGEASDDGVPKIFSLRGVALRGNGMHCTLLCPDQCDCLYWQKAP